MNRRYYITPPITDIPEFLKRSYVMDVPAKIREMIQWSKMEYNKSVRQANLKGAMRFVLFLQREYSAYRILAESDTFKDILALLNEDNYNQLSSRERQFIRRTYEMYRALGGNPVG